MFHSNEPSTRWAVQRAVHDVGNIEQGELDLRGEETEDKIIDISISQASF